jgi:hypothetical protein
MRTPHTYLEGVIPFMYWGYGLQGCSIARRPCPQRRPVVCMGFGSCTLSIFPCPASALGLGRPFFWPVIGPNPNPRYLPNILISLLLLVPL